jgi:dipeptidyl aminopeptidase/acylaminoacyl peptidase
MRRSLASLPFLLLAPLAHAAPFTAAEMMKLKRLADPHLSPDGKWVVYQATEIDLPGGGARNTDLWLQSLAGGEPRRLTSHAKSDSRGRFSPDGKRVAFVSARDAQPQVYVIDLAGGEPRKLTSLSTGVSTFLWADDKTLVVASEIYPECGGDDACNKKKMDDAAKGSSARVYTRLLYRHWDTWDDGRVSHLLAVPVDGGAVRDLTPGERDVPPFSLGGPDDFDVSKDGKELCFARNLDPVEATSTNAELFVVPLAGGEPKKIAGAPGYDGGPRYSPDGTRIAFRAQLRAGYESDRWRLMVYDRASGKTTSLTEAFDRHVEGYAWSPDSRQIFFTATDNARDPIYVIDASGGTPRKLADGTFGDLQVSSDGKTLVATQVSLTYPSEVVRLNADGSGLARVTKLNDALLASYKLRPGESVTYTGAAGKPIQAWIVKPPDFDPAKKYPLLVLIHGGPQGVWADGWSYRWNPQLFASAGYVVFAPNPRGSIGWGQALIDDINQDWGGKAYEDVMKGTDYAEALPYVDKGRTAAAGASYGGYMINWVAGQTDRYKALVSHDGVFDLVSMYGSTEELWFVDWEFKGPYWESKEVYERWSPSRNAKSFKTPTLVIHGELDYRVPLEQGLGMYTALQRKGVPSKLLVFPDENHWVLKPANSVRWYQEVIGWLDQWTKP